MKQVKRIAATVLVVLAYVFSLWMFGCSVFERGFHGGLAAAGSIALGGLTYFAPWFVLENDDERI